MRAAIFSARPTTRSAPGYREHHDDEESQELSYPVADHTAAEGSEARALRKFYLCTMGKTWDRQRGWNTVRQDVPQDRMGEFEGVTMSPGGHTEKIQLRDNGLKTRRYRGCLCVLKRLLYSPVPDLGDVLNSLRYLTVLDLSTNSLQGRIPKGLAALHSLEELNLHHNKFCGPIPAELGRLPHLKYLRLSNNDLSGLIPEEVEEMATLELLDCSNNELSGLLPAWACMGTVHAEVGDPFPKQMYLFVMDAPPKSLLGVSHYAREAQAKLRAAAWIQWHLGKDDTPTVEEQPQPQLLTRHLGDTQVRLVVLPQHDRARVRFDVKVDADASRITTFGVAGGLPRGFPTTVFGAVTDDAAFMSLDDFPHKVVEVNSISPETASTGNHTSRRGRFTADEHHGGGGAASVGVEGRSATARVREVEMQEYQSVDPDEAGVAIDNPVPAVVPPPCASFSLKSDDLFVESWEEFVRRNDRCNNSFCYFVHNYAMLPLLVLTSSAAFLAPLWAILLFYPLIYLIYALGIMACLTPLMVTFEGLVRGHGPLGGKIALFMAWALLCYFVFWLARNIVFGVIMFVAFALVYIAPLTVILLLRCCGVHPASSRWTMFGLSPLDLPILTFAVEPGDGAPTNGV